MFSLSSPPSLRSTIALAAFSAALAGLQTTATAQNNSLFGTRGPASQIGTNLRGSMVGEGTTFGTTVQDIGLGGTQSGAGQGQSDFVGRSDNADRFVGDQRVGQQSPGTTGSRFGGVGARQRSTGPTRFGAEQMPQSTRTSTRIIRPRQKIAFTFPPRPASVIDTSLVKRMSQVTASESHSGDISAVVNDQGVVVLTGTVNSPEAKRLAAIMARLEPGVRDVDNQLKVAGETEGE